MENGDNPHWSAAPTLKFIPFFATMFVHYARIFREHRIELQGRKVWLGYEVGEIFRRTSGISPVRSRDKISDR